MQFLPLLSILKRSTFCSSCKSCKRCPGFTSTVMQFKKPHFASSRSVFKASMIIWPQVLLVLQSARMLSFLLSCWNRKATSIVNAFLPVVPADNSLGNSACYFCCCCSAPITIALSIVVDSSSSSDTSDSQMNHPRLFQRILAPSPTSLRWRVARHHPSSRPLDKQVDVFSATNKDRLLWDSICW